MKKIIRWPAILLLGFNPFNSFATPDNAHTDPVTPLLPPITVMLTLSDVPENLLDDNSYSAFAGLHAPLTTDFISVGKKLVRDMMYLMKNTYESASPSLMDIHGKIRTHAFSSTQPAITCQVLEKYYPCAHALELVDTLGEDKLNVDCRLNEADSCVNNFLSHRELIESFIKQNQVLLTRYQTALKNRSFQHYLQGYAEPDLLPQSLATLSNLRLAQATFLIIDGHTKDGLMLLTEEKKLWKKILADNHTLIPTDLLLAFERLNAIGFVLNQWLDLFDFRNHITAEETQALAAAFGKPFENRIFFALNNDLRYRYRSLYYFNRSQSQKPEALINPQRQTETAIDFAADFTPQDPSKPLDINATLNILYETHQEFLTRFAALTLPESADFYQHYILKNQTEAQNTAFFKEAASHYQDKNPLNQERLQSYATLWQKNTFLKQYDFITISRLIETKHKILAAKIRIDEIEQFLKEMGDKAMNPYTKTYFIWDADEQTLSTSLLDDSFTHHADGLFKINIILF